MLQSKEELLDTLEQAHKAFQEGNDEEYIKISQRIPMPPHIAFAAKKIWGGQCLKNSGFDLSQAEAKYGQQWIDQ